MSTADSEGVKRSEVVGWYLEKIGDQIESEEELIEKKTLIEKVLDRLIFHVSIGKRTPFCIYSIK